MPDTGDLILSRDDFKFPLDTHQQTYTLAIFISGSEQLRGAVIALVRRVSGSVELAFDLASELEEYFGNATATFLLDQGQHDTLASKIIRNWLEDVEWLSLAEYVEHIATNRAKASDPLYSWHRPRHPRDGTRERHTKKGDTDGNDRSSARTRNE